MRFGLLFRLVLAFFALVLLCTTDVNNIEESLAQPTKTLEAKIIIPKELPTATPTITPNIVTPTPTSTPKPPTPTSTSTQTVLPTYHVVQKGETLQGIADKYGIPITYIAYKNLIQNLDLIYEGQQLYIEESPEDLEALYAQNGKLIVVKLSTQTLTAYENGEAVATFAISSGVADFPTVTGTFYVYAKYETTRMTAYDYDIPNVPWTMYYYLGYALHGAPWHNNFGTPMSHGCVNLSVPNAKWLYEWTPYYTIVKVVQ